MRFKEKLKKIFKYSLLPISMAIALLFAFTSNTYAYELTSDGNIKSNNLLDNNSFVNIGSLDANANESGVVITGQNSIDWNKYIQYDITLSTYQNGYYNLSYNQNPSSIVYIFVDNTQVYGDGQNVSTSQNINFNVTTTYTFTIHIRFYQTCNITNLRLTKGYGQKNYEKFGYWYSQDNSSLIPEIFGGCKLELYQLSNNQVVMSTYYQYTGGRSFVIPRNFRDYIEAHTTTYYGLKIYLNHSTNYILNARIFENAWETDINLIYSYTNATYSFTNINDYLDYLTCDTKMQEYDIIDYQRLNGADHSDIELNISPNSYSYNIGYETGYSQGYSDGDTNGYKIGEIYGRSVGYEEGYNIGMEGNNSLYNMIMAIVDTPITIFKQIFDFNVLGVDLTQLVFSIVTLLVTIFFIKKIK